MVNFPKYFNTKEDVLNCIPVFTEQTKSYLTMILSEIENWVLIGKLADSDVGTTDATHRVLDIKEEDIVKERYQYEWKEVINCKLYDLGFTKEEAQELIKY